MIISRYFRRQLQPLILLSGFIALCILFYFSLLDALNKRDELPTSSQVIRRKEKLSKGDLKLQRLFEESVVWAALPKDQKRERLLENPIYRNFKIYKTEKKKKVNIVLVVSSGPRRAERRAAIRNTWWNQCKTTAGVSIECIFFTDLQRPSDQFYEAIQNESSTYNDMQFQPLRGGIEFGVRFLFHVIWAKTHFDFDYFMRVDDDYFFCMERFLHEVTVPTERLFHWGYTHCIMGIVRPEESMIMLSNDLVETYIFQDPHKMRCHPWADQMIGVWTTDIDMHNLFRNDDRLHHSPIAQNTPELQTIDNVCHKYIGIHGTYPVDMLRFWKHRGEKLPKFTSSADRDAKIGNLEINSEVCDLPHSFNYAIFQREWQYEPKRCIYDPIWDTKKQSVVGGVYAGREDDKRLSEEEVKNKIKPKIE